MVIAIEGANGESEWAAFQWNPNEGKWAFYSSKNACSVQGDIEECAKNFKAFVFDKTWERVKVEE